MRTSIDIHLLAIALFLVCCRALNAASRKACDLLTPEMAATLAGTKVDAPMDAGFLCIYSAQDRKVSIEFSVSDASERDAKSFLRDRGGAKQGDTYESIPSLPSKNLLVATGHQEGLTVFAKGKEINLIVNRPVAPELKTNMIEVMKRIVAQF